MIRSPDQIDKHDHRADAMTSALMDAAETYPVATRLMDAWDDLPRSVQVATAIRTAEALEVVHIAPAEALDCAAHSGNATRSRLPPGAGLGIAVLLTLGAYIAFATWAVLA